MTTLAPPPALCACPTCGLVQQVPDIPQGRRARCPRCRATVARQAGAAAASLSASRAAAFSGAALILYPPAMLLPVIAIERMGHRHSSTIWGGVVELMSDGQVVIALVVFVCSVLIPLFKIGAMFVLCAGEAGAGGGAGGGVGGIGRFLHRRHRALTFRALERIGRWGMLDVLLVAVLVAAVKLGDLLTIEPGPGAIAFAGVVICSLLASATFDPLAIWREDRP